MTAEPSTGMSFCLGDIPPRPIKSDHRHRPPAQLPPWLLSLPWPSCCMPSQRMLKETLAEIQRHGGVMPESDPIQVSYVDGHLRVLEPHWLKFFAAHQLHLHHVPVRILGAPRRRTMVLETFWGPPRLPYPGYVPALADFEFRRLTDAADAVGEKPIALGVDSLMETGFSHLCWRYFYVSTPFFSGDTLLAVTDHFTETAAATAKFLGQRVFLAGPKSDSLTELQEDSSVATVKPSDAPKIDLVLFRPQWMHETGLCFVKNSGVLELLHALKECGAIDTRSIRVALGGSDDLNRPDPAADRCIMWAQYRFGPGGMPWILDEIDPYGVSYPEEEKRALGREREEKPEDF